MKVSPAGRFWALGPRLTARHLELACWISGLALAAALIATSTSDVVGPSSPPGTQTRDMSSLAAAVNDPAPLVTSTTAYMGGPATDYQTRCIKRVIALTAYWPSLDVGKQIERQCLMRRVPLAGTPRRWTAMTCTRVFVWRPQIASARPSGCPN